MSLFSCFSRPAVRVESRRVRSMIEELEDRQFFSVAPLLAAAPVTDTLKTQTAVFAAKIAKNGTKTMLPLTITGVKVVDNTLVATGKVGNTVFEVPITVTTKPAAEAAATDVAAAQADCPILNLELGPIHLNLLGLHVDTSKICLDITAHQGGGLLGDLLCGVSNLLNNGGLLGNILGNLNQGQLNTILTGLTDLLNNIFGQLTSPTAVVGSGQTAAAALLPGHVCDILNLSLGPVDLNLLGLQVHLDNCNNGPVTLDITAVSGGGLLGNLLCNVDNLLNNPSNPNALANLLGRISTIINGLI